VIEQVRALGPFDAIFIDANHTLPFVEKDFGQLTADGRIIAFHDIAWRRAPEWVGTRIDVPEFWDRVKDHYRHAGTEALPDRQEQRHRCPVAGLTICTWVGRQIRPDYVEKLFAGVRRNLEQDYVPMVTTPPAEDLHLTEMKGCFARLRMFDPAWQAANGIEPGDRIVCMDLDLVVTGSLDELFDRPKSRSSSCRASMRSTRARSTARCGCWRPATGPTSGMNSRPNWRQRCRSTNSPTTRRGWPT
jgi:hypothetical protein